MNNELDRIDRDNQKSRLKDLGENDDFFSGKSGCKSHKKIYRDPWWKLWGRRVAEEIVVYEGEPYVGMNGLMSYIGKDNETYIRKFDEEGKLSFVSTPSISWDMKKGVLIGNDGREVEDGEIGPLIADDKVVSKTNGKRKVVAKGELKEILRERLSAGALAEKESQLKKVSDGYWKFNRPNIFLRGQKNKAEEERASANKELYSKALREKRGSKR